MATRKNSIARLVDAMRGRSVTSIAKEVRVSRVSVDAWRLGTFKPKPKARARLVRAAERQAAELLRLAKAVEDGR